MSTEKPRIVKAIHAYTPVNNDELRLGKGDLITVTQKEDGGWWEGTLNGRTGWFPSNYVTEDFSPLSPVSAFSYNDKSQPGTPTKKSSSSQSTPTASPLPNDEQLKYRQMVLVDLIDSEDLFISELQQLWEKYLQHLPRTGLLTAAEMSILIGNLLEIIHNHNTLLLNPLRAEQIKPSREQRIGKLFLEVAPRLESTHRTYCENHPKAAQLIDKCKDDLGGFMESRGAVPGILTLLTALSSPFRRFERYPSLILEIERHVEESHKDRGDLQRSIEYYKEIDKSSKQLRKQKEMELEVLHGTIAGWEGSDVSQFGEIIHMSLVHISQDLQPRYFVLFANTLLILSYNSEQNTLGYEGKIPVSGITLPPVSEKNKHLSAAFEIAGPMIEAILVNCGTKTAKDTWLTHLNKVLKLNRFPSIGSSPSQSFGQLAPPVQAWSISRLRPNPPTNPLLVDATPPPPSSSSGGKSTPTKSGSSNHDAGQGKGTGLQAQAQPQLTHEEDMTILSIVDTFCSANRQTSGGGGGQGSGDGTKNPRTLAQLVFSLRDEMTVLKASLGNVALELKEETRARSALHGLVQAHISSRTTNGESRPTP